MNKALLASVASVVAAFGITAPAHASLVLNSQLFFSAQGFGNAPRDLTVQRMGNTTSPESGCVGVSGSGGIVIGSAACIPNATILPNGVTNVGGDEPNPQADNSQYGIPTVSSLGWTSAANIAVLFNATEPGGDNITLNDLTLKFYSPTGTLIQAIDTAGAIDFASTLQGNGSAGFVFTVDAQQQALLNGSVFNQAGVGNFRVALEATLSNSSGGPESFLLANTAAAVPEPSTWGMMLVGFGLLGGAMRRRKNTRIHGRVRFA